VPHGAHHDRKIACALQHPGTVIVATTVQDQFFRKPSFKPRLPEFLVHGRQVSRSRESREDPAFAALPAAGLQSFQSAITEWHEPSAIVSLAVAYEEHTIVPIDVLDPGTEKLFLVAHSCIPDENNNVRERGVHFASP